MNTSLVRKSVLLALILLGLVGLLLLQQPQLRFWQKADAAPVYGQLTADQVTKIAFTKEETTELVKNGSSWQVGEFRANPALVDRCVTTLLALNKMTPVSHNIDKFARYGVAENSLNVQLWAGNSQQPRLILGKAGPTYGTTYFEVEGESAVFLAPHNLQTECSPTDWRDLTIFAFEGPQITTYQVTAPGKNYTLQKTDSGWQAADSPSTQLKTQEITSILYAFAQLKAKDLQLIPTEGDSFTSQSTITATTESGQTYRLEIGAPFTKEEGSDYPARKEGDTQNAWVLSSYSVQDLTPNLERLQPSEESPSN